MRKVVFILGLNFSGSHYLSLLLGSHSHALHIGEAKRARKQAGSKQPCDLCGGANDCAIFRGVEPGHVDDLFPTVFGNVGPGIELIVDNSKKPRWAGRFLQDDRFEKHFIHLIRDPRATMRRLSLEPLPRAKRVRWARRHPRYAPQLLFANPRRYYLYKWLLENGNITHFLHRHGLDYSLVTYRDLATDPEAEVAWLCRRLGLEFEHSQISYWDFEHHGSQKPQYEWVKQAKTRLVDLRWKEFLDEEEQRGVVEHSSVLRYLDCLGLVFTDDGLIRR